MVRLQRRGLHCGVLDIAFEQLDLKLELMCVIRQPTKGFICAVRAFVLQCPAQIKNGHADIFKNVYREFFSLGLAGFLKTDIQAKGVVDGARKLLETQNLSLIHISEPTRPVGISRMPSSA